MSPTQNLANHTKFDPPFHFFIAPVFALNAIYSIVKAVRNPSLDSAWIGIVALGLLAMAFKMRLNSLKVQDRVIRLEERLRLSGLLPEPLRSRIYELTEQQLISLRFASDAEIPGLVAMTFSNQLSPADIKKSIVNWRADVFRV
jgi:hypothetical protein